MAETRNHCAPSAAAAASFLFCFLFSLLALDLPRQCFGQNPDGAAMGELARLLSGVPSSWKPQVDHCTCDYVICFGGRVISINLTSCGVSGSLSPAIDDLSLLTSLRLELNNISGPLPRLSKLTSLQEINLQGNAFDSIQDGFFSGLSSLQKIYLPLAPWNLSQDIVSAAGLVKFSAINASLTGSIPDFLGSLSSLRILSLAHNQLTGRIDVIGAMPQLIVFWIESNSFTGPIPDLPNLTV